jgi:hypothetical protein
MKTVTYAAPKGERLLLTADGFLICTATAIIATSLEMALVVTTGTEGDQGVVGVALQLVSLLGMAASVLVGVFVAWRMHGRRLDWPVGGAMIAGVIVGAPIAAAGLFALSMFSRLIQMQSQSGPWALVGILVVLVVAFAAYPVIEAVRDLGAARRTHVALDWTRLVSAGVFVLLAGVVMPAVGASSSGAGAEAGEAGIFMIPLGAIAALALLGADVFYQWRERRAAAAGQADVGPKTPETPPAEVPEPPAE